MNYLSRFIPVKIRDSLPFSVILSIGFHLILLYYIGSWVVDFGNLTVVHRFLINEAPIESKANPTVTLREIKQDPQAK